MAMLIVALLLLIAMTVEPWLRVLATVQTMHGG